MKFESQNSRRRAKQMGSAPSAPGCIEHLETRSLLTAPSLLTPAPESIVYDETPVITWEATDNAVSYDLWLTDADERVPLQVISNINATNIELTTPLPLARIRAWVRANFADSSSTAWSAPTHFVVQQRPTITGPVNPNLPALPGKLNTSSATVTWNSAAGASSFEIWFRRVTDNTETTITVANPGPTVDADGNPIVDGNGDQVTGQVRAYNLGTNLSMGQYQVSIRAIDSVGRATPWSNVHRFEIAPAVQISRPSGYTFQNPPLLEWKPVAGATHYDLWVARAGQEGAGQELVRQQSLTGTSYQLPKALADGDYVFWVRARRITSGRPEVTGIWSNRSDFSPITSNTESSTFRVVQINGPAGTTGLDPNVRLVTDLRPTVTWDAIDKAARYDVWVDRATGRSGYIQSTSSVSSWQFPSDLEAGKYIVWVRALSPTGVATRWSLPWEFTATGGVPVILSPAANSTAFPLPTITWTPVADAATYEVWISQVGVNFTYLVQNGIATNSFTPANPLDAGTYRVWVRAITSTGSALTWSSAVQFVVADADSSAPTKDVLLTSAVQEPLTPPVAVTRRAKPAVDATEQVQVTRTVTVRRDQNSRSAAETPVEPPVVDAAAPAMISTPVSTDEIPAATVEELASRFVAETWWASNTEES
ncbi:MAG: hypothetical protein KDA96_09000 [Planctomycetaceae bacterium]|nr:hypothetical protein [Planctomycetaceae bacterium]